MEKPKVLITVQGGVAEPWYDSEEVDVLMVDFDDVGSGRPPQMSEEWRQAFPTIAEDLDIKMDANRVYQLEQSRKSAEQSVRSFAADLLRGMSIDEVRTFLEAQRDKKEERR
jgi:hypothetical protein